MEINKGSGNKKFYFILAGIIACQLVVLMIIFGVAKKGWYCDEIYSYGQADCENFDRSVGTMVNTWRNGSNFKDYVTVSGNEIWNYGHIYNNLKKDSHPPLHFYLLHLISSLHPGTFSKWDGFIINALAFIIIQIYLYRLVYEITDKQYTGILTCLLFGFSTGAVNMIAYVRMYMLMTSFVVMFIYYSVRLYKANSEIKDIRKNVICSALAVYGAAMSQYTSMVYMGIMTAGFCLYYLCRKRIKLMFTYGLSMLAAVAAMIASFPVLMVQLGNKQQAISGASAYPYWLEWRISWHIICNQLFGFNTPIFANMVLFWIITVLIAVIIVYSTVRFLVRNEEWFKKYKTRAHSSLKKAAGYMTGNGMPFVIMSVSALISVYILSGQLKMYYFYPFSDRYMFFLFPIISAAAVIILQYVLRNKWIMTAAAGVLIVLSLSNGQRIHLMNNDMSGMDFRTGVSGADVIFIGDMYQRATPYSPELQDCNKCFVTTQDTYKKNRDKMCSVKDDGKKIYLIVDKNMFSDYNTDEQTSEITDFFRDLPVTEKMEEVGSTANATLYRLR